MKKYLLLLLLLTIGVQAQKFSSSDVIAFQREMDAVFKIKESSPLSEKDRAKFKGLDYYAPNADFYVVAKLTRTDSDKPFAMQTSTARKALYRRYGILTFTLDGKPMTLNVYQSAEPMQDPKYKNNLFLPFTDMTSGKETYGGGRYLDLQIPVGDKIILDFNKAYNPYCAYSKDYSCPVPPAANNLKVAVRAGVRKFKH
jgi:uncharacterized protein (DUF1684 family)